MRPHRPTLAVLALLAVLGSATRARGQGNPGSGAKVAAEALFEEARRLVADGKAADACPKFAESQKLDPSPSTLLNLASCYEKTNHPATAWATYREGASAAQAAGKMDMVAAAQRHADALFPTLPRMSVTVAAPTDGMTVNVDGVAVGRAEWGVAVPVDPGDRTIDASAPHFKPWSSKITVGHEATTIAVAVPALDAAPADAVPPPPVAPPPATPATAPPPEGPPVGHTQRVAGLVIGAVGIVGLGVGTAFALSAKSQYNSSLSQCPNAPNLCSQAGVDQRNTALTSGNVASVVLAIGGAAVVGGVVIWLTAPSAPHGEQKASLALVPTLGGGMLRGTW